MNIERTAQVIPFRGKYHSQALADIILARKVDGLVEQAIAADKAVDYMKIFEETCVEPIIEHQKSMAAHYTKHGGR